MWIVPKNLPLPASALDTVESNEDLELLESSIESSLMWRSKRSPWHFWLRRWKRVPWMRLLFGRILKHSHQKAFAGKWTSSLPDTPVSRLALPARDSEEMTLGTCGHSSLDTFKQLSLDGFSLRTSEGTSKTGCVKCLRIWEKQVTERNGEYSQRLKLEHRTGGRGYSLLPTPTASEQKYRLKGNSQAAKCLSAMAKRGELGTIGQLNPQWVEWLMGLQTGSTDLESWGTE